jgi:hypothetical protein
MTLDFLDSTSDDLQGARRGAQQALAGILHAVQLFDPRPEISNIESAQGGNIE